ncbi:MAG: tetratricopeptide repeat protein [Microscillaceae bacterium]|nr:tetratricopeptide repeat protein [Microscillaceae bacterium]MDW8461201.1 tetratricopeptide repeat protein [Cytophagales bacterium]
MPDVNVWTEQLAKAKDTAKLNLLDKLYQYYKSKQMVRAISYAKQAQDLARSYPNYPIYQGIALKNDAEIQFLQSKYKEALALAQQAESIFEELGHKKERVLVKNLIGSIYRIQGEYIQATNHFVNALQIAEKSKYQEGIALSVNNLGVVYENNGNLPKAIENYQKALQIYEQIAHEEGKSECYKNLGRVYFAKRDFDKALEYFDKSLKISEKLQNDRLIADAEQGIAKVYFERQEYEKTLTKLQKVLKIRENLSDKKAIAQTQKDLAKVYQEMQQLDKALELAQKSIKIAQTIDLKEDIMEASQILSHIYYEKQDYQRAYEYQLQYIGLKDTIFSRETNKIIANLQSSYELEKKQNELALLAREREMERQMFLQKEKQKQIEQELLRQKNREETERLLINIRQGKKNEERLRREKERQAQEYKRNEEMRKAQIALMKESEARERQVRYFLIALLILAGFFGYYFYVNNRQKKIINQRLQLQNEEIRIQREELNLKKDILEAQNEIIESKNRDIQSSILYAKRIQDAILPTEEQITKHISEYFILFKPRDIVSGDFYWFGDVTDGVTGQYKVIIAAADCTGHGVPGAFMSMIGDVLLSQIVLEKHITEPDLILNEMNAGIRKALKQKQLKPDEADHTVTQDGMDIALCVWNKQLNLLEYAGARSPMYLVENGQMKEFKPDKMPIGGYPMGEEVLFSKQTHRLTTNCWVYMASDGYQDQFNGRTGKKFKSNRFKELLLQNHHLPAAEQKNILDQTIEDWREGSEQLDDILVVGFHFQINT